MLGTIMDINYTCFYVCLSPEPYIYKLIFLARIDSLDVESLEQRVGNENQMGDVSVLERTP